MDARTLRIITVAMELAERDGYEAVRLRELAAKANVALGTVYKRFSSKEDILAGVLQMQVDALAAQIRENPVPGDTPQERLDTFFEMATDALAQRPKLAAAMLRTVASGVPELSEKVTRYHGRMTEVILAASRGEWSESPPSDDEQMMAHLLQNVWFATLVGWTGGLHDQQVVITTVQRATHLLLLGMQRS